MAKLSQNLVPKRSAADYRVLGTTYDGVRVLKPKTKPQSFTTAQIRQTIREVLQEHRTGRLSVPKNAQAGDGSKR